MSKKTILFGSASGVVQLICIALLTIICIPVFIHKLGTESYGVFSVLSVVGSLNVFTNLGMNTALVKFIAEQGKCRESDHDLVVTVILLILVLIPTTVFFIAIRELIITNLLKVPHYLYSGASSLLIFLLLTNIVLMVGQSFSAVLSAIQKVYLNNLLQIFYNIIYWSSIIVILLAGYNLREIGWAILLSTSIWFLLTLFYCMRFWGKITTNQLFTNFRRIARKQIGYGSKIYLSNMITFFIEPILKGFISYFIGIKEVGYFDIALKIKAQFQGLITRLLDPFYPYVSKVSEHVKLRNIINDVEQKFLLLSMPLISVLVFILSPLITIWLGSNNNEMITISSIVITVTHLITMSALPMYYYLVSKNLVQKTIIINTTTVIVNAVIFFLFYRKVGYYSAIIGLCSGVFISYILTLYYQKRLLSLQIFPDVNKFVKLLGIALFLILVNSVLYYVFKTTILSVFLIITTTVILLVFCYKYLRIIESTDIEFYFGSNNAVSSFLLKLLVKK